ncbi:helix-turn-helix domain-containing protein [Streptomyces sp. NPDC050658]|uniref:helix-turn-helix domain-containing protein n=1 Tax=unclassified Streptomyces TaxID=2593676 RepID=UPI0034281213
MYSFDHAEGGVMTDRIAAVDALLTRSPIELPAPAVRSHLRKAVGWTQEEVAEALGVHRQAFMRWETGQARPHPRNRAAYLRLLQGWASQCPDVAHEAGMGDFVPAP